MTISVQILDLTVVRPLVRHVERGWYGTSVGIFTSFLKKIGVQTLVQIVHGIVERKEYDLRYLLRQVVTCCVLYFSPQDKDPIGKGIVLRFVHWFKVSANFCRLY